VNVSWFDAMAYCRWRSRPDLEVRLPTRAESMAAASPDDRKYPWGSTPDPDDQHANFGNRVRRPTPVGIYPSGDGRFGHCDLVGNVWEWNGDVDPDVEATDEDRKRNGLPRYISGGAFSVDTEGLAAAKRSWFRSRSRGDVGFRVAAVLASR
jgi:iron(II)-dependent oxidoreductase